MQASVLGLVNHAHAAATELLDDAVVRDGHADHWDEILGLGLGHVNEGERGWPGPEKSIDAYPDYTH
jgi:hypothetical protein